MLKVSGLEKSFGAAHVLRGVDLSIASGESVALLGANGSGKTTTLRCIMGLARPDAGTIDLAGVDAVARSADARAHLSYLPQRPAFPATLTVRETIAVVARLRGLPTSAVDREVNACGLEALADHAVSHLSGGERQRLAMAIAFLPDVQLYIFDEPTANLDPTASRLLFRRARQLRRHGCTLLFTTHVPADVRHLASRVVLLRDGRIESSAAGEFELRRAERMLERDLLGDSDEDLVRSDHRDAGVAGSGRMRRQSARA